MAATSQLSDIREILNRLDKRLDVHDQKHIQIEKEMGETSDAVKRQGAAIFGDEKTPGMVSRVSTVENDLQKITTNLSRLTWAFVTPLIGLIVLALIIAAAQVAK